MLMVKLTLSCFDGESVNWFKKKKILPKNSLIGIKNLKIFIFFII